MDQVVDGLSLLKHPRGNMPYDRVSFGGGYQCKKD
jgi:hypothetical protein